MPALPSRRQAAVTQQPARDNEMSDYEQLSLYIAGEWITGGGRRTETVINPATGKSLGELPHATTADLDRALDASQRAFRAWRQVNQIERARILARCADLIRDNAEHIARVMTLEQGKTIAESRMEVGITADSFDWSGEECKRTYGRVIPSRYGDIRAFTVYEPIGPVAAFAPWNFPSLMPGRKVAHAIAAGCAVIVKPSEETPGTALAIARLCEQAGVPKGLVNVVFGVPADISEYLIPHPVVRKISFTGSVPVGKHLAELAGRHMKKITVELGGHSPVLIFADADVDKVVKLAAAGKYRNAGQVCISPTRFYVHESIHDRFVDGFAAAARSLKVGDGLADGTQMGPLANSRRVDAMESFVADARERGAKVHAGGNRIGNQGFFFEPTVMSDVPEDARIMHEEPFGPVAPVLRFSQFDDVVERANGLPFGLAAYAFTSSARTAAQASQLLEAGMVGINSFAIAAPEFPFGGVKDSGLGREAGLEGVLEHMVQKMVTQTGM